jgi:16S rRNA (cytosine1402-N4)-methyltransferase
MAEQLIRDATPHRPVLYQEIIHGLQPHSGGRYVDGTLGAGGHAAGILESSQPDGWLLGLDRDPYALQIAAERLAQFGGRVILKQASYTSLPEQLQGLGWVKVDGILLDLGLSSMQLDTPERGFSFLADASLDMRFDPQADQTAADLVNQLPENELADLLYRYGEEPRSRQIARSIVNSRPVNTTTELARIVARAYGHPKNRRSVTHPATRTFQALRIAVNRELEAVQTVLPAAIAALAPGGRLAVISFHSLEDRIVKEYFRQESRDCLCPPRQPVCTCGHTASLTEITRRPIQPGPAEVQTNPRSRSARLRLAEKRTQANLA